VHNARSILRDLRKPEIGAAVRDRFDRSKEDTLWYYREVASAHSFPIYAKAPTAKTRRIHRTSYFSSFKIIFVKS
jgi:hypothetical protein